MKYIPIIITKDSLNKIRVIRKYTLDNSDMKTCSSGDVVEMLLSVYENRHLDKA